MLFTFFYAENNENGVTRSIIRILRPNHLNYSVASVCIRSVPSGNIRQPQRIWHGRLDWVARDPASSILFDTKSRLVFLPRPDFNQATMEHYQRWKRVKFGATLNRYGLKPLPLFSVGPTQRTPASRAAYLVTLGAVFPPLRRSPQGTWALTEASQGFLAGPWLAYCTTRLQLPPVRSCHFE